MVSLYLQKAKYFLKRFIWVYLDQIYKLSLGFLVDVGTRDETNETSGSCLAIKNSYLKTLKHSNETMNYGMI